jgi:hypothetical protein
MRRPQLFRAFWESRCHDGSGRGHVGLSLPAMELVMKNGTFLDDDGS